ncbi:hypothetical protein SLOPH_865, partial [Spraguea lophii 42_110]
MYLCSLYSCLENKEKLYKYFTSNNYTKDILNEKIYKNKEGVKIYYNIDDNKLSCLYPPDKSKNRISICCRYEEAKIIKGNVEGCLKDLGFICSNTDDNNSNDSKDKDNVDDNNSNNNKDNTNNNKDNTNNTNNDKNITITTNDNNDNNIKDNNTNHMEIKKIVYNKDNIYFKIINNFIQLFVI